MSRGTAFLAFAAALALHWALLYPHLAATAHDFDATAIYLPYAKRLLAEGPAFLATRESIMVTPMGYAWPALLGGEMRTVKLANFLLSGLTLLLLARTAWHLHSRTAGLAAAFLFAASPLMRPFLAAPVTEPPYLFLLALWAWALSAWYRRPHGALAALAGAAFGLAILTRSAFFPWLIVLVAFFAWRRERAPLAAHLLAAAIPLAFIAKNWWLFGYPFIATGAGNALYLGNNPVTGGYDPNYLGLLYDVLAISPAHPLRLESEAVLSAAARLVIGEAGMGELAAMYARKLAAFVFVTNAEEGALWLRSWRIALVVFSAVGAFAIRQPAMRLVLAGSLAFQVAVHVPLLYTHRYSVGAMDPWLVVLAAVGLAALLARPTRRRLAVAVAASAVGALAGAWAWREAGLPQPDVFRAEHQLVWEARGVQVPRRLELEVREAPRFHPWFNYVLVMDVAAGCDTVRLAYERAAHPGLSPPVTLRLRPDGRVHRYQVGAITPLQLNGEGRLVLEAPCALNVPRIAVYSAEGAIALGEKIRGRSTGGPPAR